MTSIELKLAAEATDKAISIALYVLDLVEQHNVNAELLLAMRAKAKSEGRELTHKERQRLIDIFSVEIEKIPVKKTIRKKSKT